jgi:hypothetical protein
MAAAKAPAKRTSSSSKIYSKTRLHAGSTCLSSTKDYWTLEWFN